MRDKKDLAGESRYCSREVWEKNLTKVTNSIEHILGEKLTVVPEFHSHLEPMKRLAMDELDKQISFSYISYNGVDNVLDLPGPFSKEVDPTR